LHIFLIVLCCIAEYAQSDNISQTNNLRHHDEKRGELSISKSTSHLIQLITDSSSLNQGVDSENFVAIDKNIWNFEDSNGLTFSRSIDILSEDFQIYFGFDSSHCSSKDLFGDNNCKYNWGETVHIDLVVDIEHEFREDDMIHASLKVDYFVNWEFECHVCGQDCVITVPIVDLEIPIQMPPCPLINNDIPPTLEIPLGNDPIAGIPLRVEGDLSLKKKSDEVIAKSHILVNVN